MIDQLEKEIHEGMLDLYQHQSMSRERESIVYFYFAGIHNENITLKEEIKRLKEEYVILQNASDEVEEEKDREIERLNNILKMLKDKLDFAKRQEEEKLNRIERCMAYNNYILHESWYGGNEKKYAQRNINILLGKETELNEIPRLGSDKE